MTANLHRREFLTTTSAAAGLAAISAGAFAGEESAKELRKIGKTPRTKFAVNVEMWWRRLPFLKRILKTAALGFPAVEFWPWQRKDIAATAKLTQQLNVAVAQFTAWGFRPGLNETKNHKNFVQAIKDGCKVAKQLKCKMMTVVGGNDVKGLTQQQMHANIIAGLKLADSNRMDVVDSVTSVLAPPITPASAMARSASAITSISSVRRWLSPSSVASVSPLCALRIRIICAPRVSVCPRIS